MTNLDSLLKTPNENRNELWEDNFLTGFVDSHVNLIYPEPKSGPDGWPYLLAEVAGADKEPVQKILHWAATRGVGLAVNPQKEYPDYVLSYGMIWFFRETGRFFLRNQRPTNPMAQEVELSKGTIKHAGTPHPKFLPDYVRTILREFFRDQGLFKVKILVLTTNGSEYDLAFSLESMGTPPQSERAGIAEAIGWFLPPHYSVLLVSEKDMPEFSDL